MRAAASAASAAQLKQKSEGKLAYALNGITTELPFVDHADARVEIEAALHRLKLGAAKPAAVQTAPLVEAGQIDTVSISTTPAVTGVTA